MKQEEAARRRDLARQQNSNGEAVIDTLSDTSEHDEEGGELLDESDEENTMQVVGLVPILRSC